MTDLINLIIKSAFMDNMVFAYFLGMCSFLAVSKKVSTAEEQGIIKEKDSDFIKNIISI